MPERVIIDAIDFAHNAGIHHDKIPVREFERLQDYLVSSYGELNCTVSGILNRDAKPVLRIIVQGSINLRCQRCLGEIPYMLDLRMDLLLARNEDELSRFDENESSDCVLAAPDMDVQALIEDEIILSLPISPRHEESECSMAAASCSDAASAKPFFTALAQLKKLH